ncbi:hypothetical protein THIX_60845 [Thiomonas sp. X19]|uniref:Uncharacterized protein n=1 Tax=mine drainage metagenome TaxID=410659 RepID=E6PNH5_9ZZZZ|nr:hypothetical protein THIX_60845 [Thiomonas sp. X19]
MNSVHPRQRGEHTYHNLLFPFCRLIYRLLSKSITYMAWMRSVAEFLGYRLGAFRRWLEAAGLPTAASLAMHRKMTVVGTGLPKR